MSETFASQTISTKSSPYQLRRRPLPNPRRHVQVHSLKRRPHLTPRIHRIRWRFQNRSVLPRYRFLTHIQRQRQRRLPHRQAVFLRRVHHDRLGRRDVDALVGKRNHRHAAGQCWRPLCRQTKGKRCAAEDSAAWRRGCDESDFDSRHHILFGTISASGWSFDEPERRHNSRVSPWAP